ncbi:MAG TPA: GGDEF domain-containing protein [Telluria sp.]|nr:GGDEF domain-containing protein [Telluria sp.]
MPSNISDISPGSESPQAIRFATIVYSRLLLTGFALMPALLIGYLFYFQDPSLKFESHGFHEIAIAVATLEGVFVTYVTWLCYRSSGEALLRWMSLSFLAFVLIYAPHGAFTRLADHNMWLFLLYGPASRLAMAILLFVALLSYHHLADTAYRRTASRSWLPWIGLFLLVDLTVAFIAYSPIASAPAVRLSMEGGAFVFSVLNVAVLLLRRIRSPLMVIFAVSITVFALSSLAFILARPWNHMWWLAHAIFAAGFFLLSYGVVKAFLTTHSFSTIYSQEELMVRLAEAVARTQQELDELKHSNLALERLAASDPLTGADNRRRFIEQVEVEIARFQRSGAPFSVVALDLDNFKAINDRYGHIAGDDVLKGFVQKCREAIRPYDSIARVGGEEFMVLLPQTQLDAARAVAERLRIAVANASFASGLELLTEVTVSSGVSQSGRDGDTMDAILRVADIRLYRAKHQGRNCVIAA